MTRVLIDLSPTGGPHGARGIGRYVRGLADAIGSSLEPPLPEVVGFALPDSEIPASMPTLAPPAWFSWRAQDVGWLSGRLVVRRMLSRTGASVFHATDPQRPWLPGRLRSAVTAYDLIPWRDPAVLRQWRRHRQWIYRWYLRSLVAASRVIAISEATKRDLADRLGLDAVKIDVVYPVVASRQVEPSRDADPTFLFVGAPDPHKQPELAMAAFAAFRRRHQAGRLEFIGPLTTRQAVALTRLARSYHVLSHVTLRGHVAEEALTSALGRASAVLAVSRLEGFGLPAVEAVLAGTPVIALDTPIARETLEDAATLVPAEAESIAAAMEQPRPPLARVRAQLSARYSVSSIAASLAESYQRLLD